MDISIIVPVYNVEKYLDRCLESLLEQEKVETEILIIDDGSTDNSGKISDIYQKKYNNIYVYHKKNEGLGLTRNYGMDRARGDYILFVDSDDYIKKNSLYDLIDFMKKRKLDVAFFGRNIDKQGKIVLGHDFFPKNMPEYKELAGLSLGEPLKSDRYEIGPAWKAIYRKNFLNDKNLYFESERICLSEDYLFSANLLINKPSRKYIVPGIIAILICFLFIAIIYDHRLNTIAMQYNINFNHRLDTWQYWANKTKFSIGFWGLGIGYVDKETFLLHGKNGLINNGLIVLSGMHSDLFKKYVEIGMIPFFIWLIYILIFKTKILYKKQGFLVAEIYLLLTIYAIILYLTDNIYSYFLCNCCYILIPMAIYDKQNNMVMQ